MSARVPLPARRGRRSEAVHAGLHLFFILSLLPLPFSPPSPSSSLGLPVLPLIQTSGKLFFFFFLNSSLPESWGQAVRSCPWAEGEGGGRKRKTEGEKSRPPTNGEEGTGETPRARANERRGETEARAGARRGSPGVAPGPTLTPGFPAPRGFPVGEGEGPKSRSDLCPSKLLPAPKSVPFPPKSARSKTLQAGSHLNYRSGIWGAQIKCQPIQSATKCLRQPRA